MGIVHRSGKRICYLFLVFAHSRALSAMLPKCIFVPYQALIQGEKMNLRLLLLIGLVLTGSAAIAADKHMRSMAGVGNLGNLLEPEFTH